MLKDLNIPVLENLNAFFQVSQCFLSTLCWVGVGETSSLALADTRRISKHEETETHIQFQSKDLEPVFRRSWELDGSIKLYCFHLT